MIAFSYVWKLFGNYCGPNVFDIWLRTMTESTNKILKLHWKTRGNSSNFFLIQTRAFITNQKRKTQKFNHDEKSLPMTHVTHNAVFEVKGGYESPDINCATTGEWIFLFACL